MQHLNCRRENHITVSGTGGSHLFCFILIAKRNTAVTMPSGKHLSTETRISQRLRTFVPVNDADEKSDARLNCVVLVSICAGDIYLKLASLFHSPRIVGRQPENRH